MKHTVGVIVFCVAMLIAMGLLALYSVTFSKIEKKTSAPQVQTTSKVISATNTALEERAWKVSPRNIQGMNSFKKQAQFAFAGAVLCICLALFFDYRLLQKDWVPFLLLFICAVLLTAVFFPALGGLKVKGAARWVRLGINFQPSELAKLSIIIFLAWYGAKYPSLIRHFWKGLILPMVIISPLVLLIFREPDAGTTLFLLVLTTCMLLIMGARWYYLFIPAGLMGTALSVWLCFDPVRRARILSWLDLEGTKYDVGMQGYSSLVALGSGGLFGKGLGEGSQKMGFLPEDHTDFILPTIGEELGLFVVLFIVLLFVLLTACGLKVALRARERFGAYLAMGITLMIGVQAFINIGVVTSVLPNKGMPLPFISRGGSNIIMLLGAVGLLLSVALRGNSGKENDSLVVEEETLVEDEENVFATKKTSDHEKE